MSTGSSKRSSAQNKNHVAVFHWRSWPLRDESPRSWVLLVAIVAVMPLVWVTTGKLHLALIALCAIMLAMWRLLVPLTFEVNSRGFTQSILGRKRLIPYNAIGRYEVHRDGVLLLPRAILANHGEPSAVDFFRSLYVPFGDHQEQILEALEHYCPKLASSGSSRAKKQAT